MSAKMMAMKWETGLRFKSFLFYFKIKGNIDRAARNRPKEE
jgi:hypothetical protein